MNLKTSINFAVIAVLTLISAAGVFGQLDGNPENLCRNGFFPRESETYRLARVKGKAGDRAYFYGDEREDCPAGKNCRLKAYVIPNDELIVSRTFGDFSCAWFQPKKGSETVGWIQTDALQSVDSDLNPAAAAWLGKWSYGSSEIRITKSKKAGFFEIGGEAYWKGLGDNIHTGEMEDTAKPAGNLLKIGAGSKEEYECRATMQLLGKYLIVADNLQCGGANVTFTGIYLKN
ncbi:MAG: hypothetical protein JSS81_01730 [Acidobacteria bacterium]|nr:hypothetical protein [Acidobacteriota bacterium]